MYRAVLAQDRPEWCDRCTIRASIIPDVTAHNILIDDRGEVFLVDFDNACSETARPLATTRRRTPAALAAQGRARDGQRRFDAEAWRELERGYDEPAAASATR